jgi:plasmid rolling circle replication initiator protein Rep
MEENRKAWIEAEKNPLLNEVRQDHNSEEGHEKRLARYSTAKARQQKVTDYILQQNEINDKPTFLKELDALQECGSFLVFRHYYELEKYRMLAGCTCKKHLLCSLCAIRRAAKYVAVYDEKIKQVQADQAFDFLFITLTIKNGPDLSERYSHLRESFKKLLQRRKDSLMVKQKKKSLFRFVEGAIFSYEVTFNDDSREYHPHLHMIALVKKGTFDFQEKTYGEKPVNLVPELWAGLVQDWKEITGDSKIVDVRLIDDEEGKMSALVETFKYALKFGEMAPVVQLECYKVLKTRRLIGSMGELYGVSVPENLSDELLPGEEKYIDLVYQYSGIAGYQLTTHGETSLQCSTLSQRFVPNKQRKQKGDAELRFQDRVTDYIKNKNMGSVASAERLEQSASSETRF